MLCGGGIPHLDAAELLMVWSLLLAPLVRDSIPLQGSEGGPTHDPRLWTDEIDRSLLVSLVPGVGLWLPAEGVPFSSLLKGQDVDAEGSVTAFDLCFFCTFIPATESRRCSATSPQTGLSYKSPLGRPHEWGQRDILGDPVEQFHAFNGLAES